MATCPICKSETADNAVSCPSCGYRFHEATQAFKAVAVDSSTPEPVAASANVPTLTIQYGRQEGLVYKLDGDAATIGRAPQCTIFLNDMTVSRTHAKLERLGQAWTIQDTGSFNGVWVNNANIDHVVLKDGDLIQIGCFVLKYAQ